MSLVMVLATRPARLEALQGMPAQAPGGDFYYSVRRHDTDPFIAHLEALCATLLSVRLHIVSDARNERLSAAALGELAGRGAISAIRFCGPRGFAHALRKEPDAVGLGSVRFHQEAFDMR